MLIINNEEDISYVIGAIVSYPDEYSIDIRTTHLKSIFLSQLKKYIPDLYIIQGNSSERRLLKDLSSISVNDLVVMDNVKNSNNIDILNRKIYLY